MNRSILLILLLVGWISISAPPVPAQTHPFAIEQTTPDLKSIPDLFQWGPTSVSYSQSWSGNQSFSRGYLLKDMYARLTGTLDFEARVGLSFTPGTRLDGSSNSSELEIPFAAINWRPSDNFSLRVEYSQGSYYPDRGFMGTDSFFDSVPWYHRNDRSGLRPGTYRTDTD
jgi:hypothetical protein